jgi:hypothetical protein
MKKNRNIIAILVAATLLLIFQRGSIAADRQEAEKLLVGFWSIHFPIPDYSWGYVFLDDYTYVYYNHSLANIKKKYDGSMGKWKIMDNKIYIFKEKDFYWKKEWVEDKSIGYIPGESNSLYSLKSGGKWEMIGDIESYTNAKIYKNYNNRTSAKPANMMLRPPEYKSDLPFWKVVLQPMADIDIKRIIEDRRNL